MLVLSAQVLPATSSGVHSQGTLLRSVMSRIVPVRTPLGGLSVMRIVVKSSTSPR